MPTNDFLPFATGGSANVSTQAAYAADAVVGTGFQAGVAPSAKFNKALRQSTFVAAAVGQLIADATGLNAADDGVVANFEKQLALAIDLARYAVDTGTANVYAVAYNPAVIAVIDGMVLRFKAKTANTGASTFNPNGLTAQPIVGGNHSAMQGGEIVANGDVWVQWNSTLAAWVLIDSTGGGMQVGPATQSNHALPLGQVVTPTNDATFASSTSFPASTSWVRGAMSAIATAAGFASSITPTLGANGYIKFPSWLGGWTVQWGITASGIANAGYAAVTFPLSFPNSVIQVYATSDSSSANTNNYSVSVIGASITGSGFNISNNSNTSGAVTARWIAFGK